MRACEEEKNNIVPRQARPPTHFFVRVRRLLQFLNEVVRALHRRSRLLPPSCCFMLLALRRLHRPSSDRRVTFTTNAIVVRLRGAAYGAAAVGCSTVTRLSARCRHRHRHIRRRLVRRPSIYGPHRGSRCRTQVEDREHAHSHDAKCHGSRAVAAASHWGRNLTPPRRRSRAEGSNSRGQ